MWESRYILRLQVYMLLIRNINFSKQLPAQLCVHMILIELKFYFILEKPINWRKFIIAQFARRMDNKKMLNKQNETLPNKAERVKKSGKEERMGIGNWTPDWLQAFNSINFFVVILCIASLTQGNSFIALLYSFRESFLSRGAFVWIWMFCQPSISAIKPQNNLDTRKVFNAFWGSYAAFLFF